MSPENALGATHRPFAFALLVAAAAVTACSGAASHDLFGPDACADQDCGRVEPAPAGDDAATRSDVSVALDGGQDATDTGDATAAGTPCGTDDECDSRLCNWKTNQCSTPAAIGAACSRDKECAGNLCNWKTSQCAAPGAIGAACSRDSECAGNLCNWKTSQCATRQPSGGPCRRNSECTSGTCLSSDVCK